ncbi:MAG: glycosyltransferase family 4 protein [Planctomycetaceae bacterium]
MAAGIACETVDLLFEFSTLNGGEKSMLSVLARLAGRSDLKFRALCPADGPLADCLRTLQIPVLEFNVRNVDGNRRPSDQLVAELASICAQHGIRRLHANSLSMSRLTGQLARKQPSGTIIHTGHLRDIIGLSRAAISDLNRNDALIAVSEATRSFHRRQGLDVDGSRCVVIHNGVDPDQFRPRERSALRAELLPQVPPHSIVALSVGQICLRKGQLDAAKAVVDLNRLSHDTMRPVFLVISGERHSAKDESVAYEQAIRDVFNSAGQSERLIMAGYRSDVELLMNAADVLIHAARQEPFGRVLLEASASGIPIVATDVGGTQELLRPDVDALLVPAAQPAAIADAVRKMITSPQLASQLSTSARERTTSEFTAEHSATALADFWNQCEGRFV